MAILKKFFNYIFHFQKKSTLFKNIHENVSEKVEELDCLLKYAITRYNKEFLTLRKNEERYKRMMDATDDQVFLKDQLGKYLIANKALQNYLNKSEKEIIGKSDFELMDRLIAKRCKISDKIALASDNISTSIEQNGEKIYEVRKTKAILPDNKIGISGFIRDITDDYMAREKISILTSTFLNLTNNYQDNINELVKVGCFLLNGKYAMYNKLEESYICTFARYNIPDGFPNIFYPEDTLSGKIFKPNFYKDSILIKKLDLSEYFDNIFVKELHLKTYFGHPVNINKQPLGVFSILYDKDIFPKEIDQKIISLIAGLFEAEERRNNKERYYQDFINSLPQIIFEIDLKGNILFINQQALINFNYSKEDIKNLNIYDLIIPEQHQYLNEHINDLITTGQSQNNIKYTIKLKDGNIKDINTFTIPVEKNNKIVGMRGVII